MKSATRKEIQEKIDEKLYRIAVMNKEILDNKKTLLLMSDKHQQYTESEEDVVISKRPKNVVKKLIGRIHWKEDFNDEDTGKPITIKRQQVVRIDGEWLRSAFY